MKKGLLTLVLACLGSLSSWSQTATELKNDFPNAFIGHWKGKLNWQKNGSAQQTFAMQLIVKPLSDSTYSWQIIYGEQQTDNRPYVLKPVNPKLGHWQVDELNGIVLDSYVFNDCLTGAFTVQGSTIVDKYTVRGDQMDVQFLTVLLNQKNTTGKGTDESPLVDSYRIPSLQTGTLYKQTN